MSKESVFISFNAIYEEDCLDANLIIEKINNWIKNPSSKEDLIALINIFDEFEYKCLMI